jgi:hypothetical protein
MTCGRVADMPGIDDFEGRVVEGFADEARLGPSIDALLSHLLSGLPGYSRRPTDGVLLERSRIDGRQAFGAGLVVMMDQSVEPVRATFTLDDSGTSLRSARIDFGDAATTIGYGSREHRKLSHAILIEPSADRAWKQSFHRDEAGWHHEAG